MLGSLVVMAIFWLFGWKVEISKKISENVKWEEMDHLWNGVGFGHLFGP